MRIYSDSLTDADLNDSLAAVAHYLYFRLLWPIGGTRLRSRCWGFKLGSRASNRHENTGKWGAGDDYAASWDEHGHFIAQLFARDPAARVGPYDGIDAFTLATKGKYSLTA